MDLETVAPTSKVRILMVEDNPADVRLIQEMLKESVSTEFEVTPAKTLKEALKCYSEDTFDVLLLDICLPDSDGLDTLRKARLQMPKIPVVVLTGIPDKQLELEALQGGAYSCLIKGCTTARLLICTIHCAIERYKLRKRLYGQGFGLL